MTTYSERLALHAMDLDDAGHDDHTETVQRLTLAGTSRLSLAGTTRKRLEAPYSPLRSAYGTGAFTIVDDQYQLLFKRARLAGNARATLVGGADLIILDFAPVGRLVLAGKGG